MESKYFIFFIAVVLALFPEIAHAVATCNPETLRAEGFTKNIGGMLKNDPSQCETGFEHFISGTMCLVQSIVAQSMFNVYCGLFVAWLPIAQYALEMYIIFYAVAFTFGINNVSLKEAIIRFIKISIIYLLTVTPEYFYFWIYEMFMRMLDDISILLMDIPSAEKLADDGTKKGVLDFIDVIFVKILDPLRAVSVIAIAIGLAIITGGIGSGIIAFVMIGIGTLLLAFFRIIFTYLNAMMFLTFLMMFTPIFLTSLLFSQTRALFDRWFGSMVSYTLQPIIILAFLFVIGQALSLETLINGILCGGDATCGTVVQPTDEGYTPQTFSILGLQDITLYFPRLDILFGNALMVIINIMGFIVAWIILNMIAIGFIDKVPEIARELAKFTNVRTPGIGSARDTARDQGESDPLLYSGKGVHGPENVLRAAYGAAEHTARRGVAGAAALERAKAREESRDATSGLKPPDTALQRAAQSTTVRKGVRAGIEEKLGEKHRTGLEALKRRDAEEKARREREERDAARIAEEQRMKAAKEAELKKKQAAEASQTQDKKKKEQEEHEAHQSLNQARQYMLAEDYDTAVGICAKYPNNPEFASLLAEIQRRRS